MKIIIQKFGGTSVINEERRNSVINKIESAIEKDLNTVVVVSAIGRKGDPYATDTLIEFVKSSGIDPEPRELDLLMSCGEVISCVMLANTIKKRGYRCAVFTGGQAGIVTDDNYNDAKILRVDPKNIINCLEKGVIPIVAGFQGVTELGDVTTLGRGGSDITASIMGEALHAETIEIYTDVDGIMTADPKIVKDAKVMDAILYDEVFQMAEYGAKVINPRAVEIAMRSNIPLEIKNTASDYPGTLISSYDNRRGYIRDANKIITSVAQISNRTQVKIKFSEANQSESYDKFFDIIAKEGISIDMINIFPTYALFIVDDNKTVKLEELFKNLKYDFEMKNNCTKVTIIGNRMKGVPGVMAKTVAALREEGIEILQSSDSHTTISCLINSEFTNKAVNSLHRKFELGK